MRRSKVAMISALLSPDRAAAHGQDEGEAEALAVFGVELADVLQLFGRAVGQAGLLLLIGRLGRERVGLHLLAGQLRVSADQIELGLLAGLGQHLGHGVLDMRQDLKGRCSSAFGNPGRVLVQAIEQVGGGCRIGGIQLFQGQSHVAINPCGKRSAQ
jgi:hypothetical protein